jgi:hypothetical protein
MKRDMGHRKWLDEYPVLKQVDENQPFTVPPGYFNELENNITSAISLEELKSEKGFTIPKNYFDELNGHIHNRINIEQFAAGKFSTPENYFDELNGNIQSRINIEQFAAGKFTTPENYFDELSGDIESRINIEAFNTGKGLTVPENYFDELSSKIQSRINIEEFVNNKAAGHTVPADYFENLEMQVSSRIVVEEMLNTEEDFAVPAGYFDKLNTVIINKTIKQDEIIRRGVVRKMFATGAFKYAAAACFALVVGTGILIAELTTPPAAVAHDKTYLHKALSTVSTGDIQTYLQDDVDATETQHIVGDETSAADDANLNNALQSISTNN